MSQLSKSKLNVALAASAIVLLLSGCAGSADPAPAPSVDVTLPSECKSLYDPEALNDLQTIVPPLNDVTVGISSTQIPELEELLGEDKIELRCTWGNKPEFVIVTQIAFVSSQQQQQIAQILGENGFARNDESYQGSFFARSQQSDFESDDEEGDSAESPAPDADSDEPIAVDVNLETHYFQDGVWVSSYLNNAIVPGYTESVMKAIWPSS